MSSARSSSLNLLRRWLRPRAQTPLDKGRPAILDGASAVAALEATLCDSAALGATWPAALSARAWDNAEQLGLQPLAPDTSRVESDDPRGALAAAIGLATSGQRATVFLSGPDLASATDLLAMAAGRHVPLVIHLACRALSRHAHPLGSGHEAYHAAADAGIVTLFAKNAQEALDLTLAARRLAERALVPVLVAIDGEPTAAGASDVVFPSETLLRELLGESADHIEPAGTAQAYWFGRARRRVPRSFDADHPAMLWPLAGPEIWHLGVAADRAFVADRLAGELDQILGDLSEHTGRPLARLDDDSRPADIVLITQGSLVENARVVADWAAEHEHLNVRVVGLRSLRPLPGAALAEAIRPARTVAVLERGDTPLAGDGPLMREVRAVLDRACENARYGTDTHPGYPTISDKHAPRLVQAVAGLGGATVRSADLLALMRELREPKRSLIYLGLSFLRDSSYPKRQALIDALRRDHADLDRLTLKTTDAPPAVLQPPALAAAVDRPVGPAFDGLAPDLAALLHKLFGGHVRTTPGLSWQRCDTHVTDRLVHADQPLPPVADQPAGVLIATGPRLAASSAEHLVEGAALLRVALPGRAPCRVSSRVAKLLEQHHVHGHVVDLPEDTPHLDQPWAVQELTLGAAVALWARQTDRQLPTAGKLRDARAACLPENDTDQQRRRIDLFIAATGALRETDWHECVSVDDSTGELRVPEPIRHIRRTDATADALPRFWDQTGVLYRDDTQHELCADPYQAAGAVPPLSAGFRDLSASLRVLPVLDPEHCDGHAALWTSCPDASVAPVVISTRALLDAGMALAAAAGADVDALQGVAAPLAKLAHTRVKKSESRAGSAGDLLREAFDALAKKMNLSGERRDGLEQALTAVINQVDDLVLVRTRPFFDDREKDAPGSGELFTLLVNPDACKSPELLLAENHERGLKGIPATRETIAEARRLWQLWQQMPDASGETIAAVADHPDVGPLGAALLSRHCRMAMAAGDGAEPGSGALLILRHALALIEAHVQPRIQRQLQRIDALRQQLAEQIRETMAAGLPLADLDALADGLDALGRPDVDLAELAGKVEQALAGGHVDGERLGRLVECARGLADLRWRISQGVNGLGRARAGVVIAVDSMARWAVVFPHNPFITPAAIDASGQVGDLARGLIEGQLRQTVAAVRLMRCAQAELDDPKGAVEAAAALASLRYDKLTADERELCPPLLVVGDGRSFGGRGLGQLTRLLASRLPIKVLVLSDVAGSLAAGLGVDAGGVYPESQRDDLGLLGLLGREAFVAQTSPGAPDHFARSLDAALSFDGPALIHAHAPSPQRHGFALEDMLRHARQAIASRAFPLFVYDPTATGVFGSRLSLDGNPAADAPLATGDDGRPLTPADWATSEARFAHHFSPLPDDAPAPTPAAEWLDLPPDERAGRTPFVTTSRDGQAQRLRVSDALMLEAARRLALWRVLQELAGVVTPFTEAVRREIERELASAHAAELDKLREQHAAELAALERDFNTQATLRVTDRLMALAGYKTNGDSAEGGSA